MLGLNTALQFIFHPFSSCIFKITLPVKHHSSDCLSTQIAGGWGSCMSGMTLFGISSLTDIMQL